MARYLVDTNVMLAASAAFDTLSLLAERAMPEEIEFRETIFQWLANFEASGHIIVLDEEGTIRDEYERNMPFNPAMQDQEYGMKVLQNKIDYLQVNYVPIDVLDANGERIALLSDELETIVHDRADRKWVASSQSTNILYEEIPPIVYGAETDWYVIEQALAEHDIHFERLLPDDWYEARISRA